MKLVKHIDKEVTELYLLDEEGKILITGSVPRLEERQNEDLLLYLEAGKMLKLALKQNIIQIDEVDEVGVKTLKYVSKVAELKEDFKND